MDFAQGLGYHLSKEMKINTTDRVVMGVGLILGAAAYALHLFLGRDSRFVETVYSRGLFVGFRWIWDYTLGLLPMPLIQLFIFAGLLFITVGLVLRLKRKKPASPSAAGIVYRGTLLVLGTAGYLVCAFYFLWGFNYNRIGIESHLDLKIQPLTLTDLRAEALWAATRASEARKGIPDAGDRPLSLISLPGNLEEVLRRSHQSLLRRLDYPAPGRVRVRLFHPGSLMMLVNVSGIYIPYCGEGYIPSTALAVERPFDMAHEMAHAFGFTGEEDANFLAFLACRESGSAPVAYSGYLNYWLYAARELRGVSPAEYGDMWERLPEGMRQDIRAIVLSWRRFEGPLREAGRRVQDGYLKSQGIREGSLSYSRMVMLVAAWRSRAPEEKP